MKRFVVFIIFASLLVGYAGYAQGIGFGVRRCSSRASYRTVRRSCYTPSFYTAVQQTPCSPCEIAELQSIGPCEACETVVETVDPCGATQLIESDAAPCDPVETITCETCVDGVCPLPARTPIRTALSVPRNVVRAVAETVALARINSIRARAGAGPVVLDERLCDGCVAHSVYMARSNHLVHASGYPEIIAQNGDGLESAVVNQWARSSGHYQIMTSRTYTRVGLGVYRDSRGRCWCTARFQ